MSDYKTILYQKQRQGVLITLNRPKALNAMNEELMIEHSPKLKPIRRFEPSSSPARAALFRSARTSAATILKQRGPTAFPRELRSMRLTTNFATRIARTSSSANSTAGSIPSPSSAP
jgi:hypothetical protein